MNKGGHGSGNYRDYKTVRNPNEPSKHKIRRIKHEFAGTLLKGGMRVRVSPNQFKMALYRGDDPKGGRLFAIHGIGMGEDGMEYQLNGHVLKVDEDCCNVFLAK